MTDPGSDCSDIAISGGTNPGGRRENAKVSFNAMAKLAQQCRLANVVSHR